MLDKVLPSTEQNDYDMFMVTEFGPSWSEQNEGDDVIMLNEVVPSSIQQNDDDDIIMLTEVVPSSSEPCTVIHTDNVTSIQSKKRLITHFAPKSPNNN